MNFRAYTAEFVGTFALIFVGVGAIAGASIPLALSLSQAWQLAVLGAAIAWLVVRRHGVVSVLVLAGLLGVAAALAGLPPSR